jgi:endonuclease/exonuclease/phosphatase family metal-dependent hydrolase
MKQVLLWLLLARQLFAGSFTVGTYNLELYTDTPVFNLPPKSEEARKIIRQSIKALNADILALQEIGSPKGLQELRAALKNDGLDYPYFEHVISYDTNLHLAFLSKYPITRRNPHTNENFLFQGRRFHVLRGFAEIEVEMPGNFRCTLITAHLKSKRIAVEADQQGLREEEAVLLREKIDQFFKREPRGNLIVLGDLNDGITTKTARTVLGRGKTRLFDARPEERNGDSLPNPNFRYEPRRIVWTHYFGKEETYSRIDYILTSPSLRDKYHPEKSFILNLPDWGAGSDHRPLRAAFEF